MRRICVDGLLTSVLVVAPVLTAAADETTDLKLEEVVVTAQRRAERLQDVPISVQVVGAPELAERNLNSLTALTQKVPSVRVGGGSRTSNLFIRGIGSGQNQSFDQSVGVFIDDIYHGRGRSTAASFLDLDRVEILKGPQSTFFGNNAIAGAFNIVSKKPGDSFEAQARVLYGQDGAYAVEGAIGAPWTDTIAVRGAVIASGQDGWIRNVNTGQDYPAEDSSAARMTFGFTPSDNFDATLKIEGSQYEQNGGLYLQGEACPPQTPFTATGFCSVAVAAGVPTGLDSDRIASSPGEGIELSTAEYVLTANYRNWNHTFSSVSGFYNYHYNLKLDLDFTPSTLVNAEVPERYNQFSQEFRVQSDETGRIEYLAGVYFQTDEVDFRQDQSFFFVSPTINASAPLAPLRPYLPLGQRITSHQDEKSYAVFGSVSWNVTEQLKLTAGLRGSKVDKQYDGSYSFGTATQDYGGLVALPANLQPLAAAIGLGPAYAPSAARTDKAWLPSAKVQYTFNPDAMAYVSFAKGFKAGGFNGADNTGNAANIPFAPEHVKAYEAGFKSEWLGGRALLNLAVFRSDYSDLQVSQNSFNAAGTSVGVVKNAAESRSQGVELETQWAVSRDFHLMMNAAYIDSHYVDYTGVPLTQTQTAAFNACVAATPPPRTACIAIGTQDLSDRPTQFAPEWSGSIVANYRFPLPAEHTLTANLIGIYSSSYFTESTDDAFTEQASYWRLDARLTAQSPDERWAIDLIGQNLTDRNVLSYGAPWPRSLGSYVLQNQQPRAVTVQVRLNW